MRKKGPKTKAEKLIRKGAGVPFKRPWQKRKPLKCQQVRALFGILKYGKNHIKNRYLFRAQRHAKRCPLCKVIGGFVFN